MPPVLFLIHRLVLSFTGKLQECADPILMIVIAYRVAVEAGNTNTAFPMITEVRIERYSNTKSLRPLDL